MRHIEFLEQMIIESNLRLKIKRERFKRFKFKNSPKVRVRE